MAGKGRDHQCKQIVIVVLEGEKVVLGENTGLTPLCRALRDVVNPEDEIIVLTLLHVKITTSEASSVSGHCNQSCDQADPYIRFLHEEISLRKDVFLRIFRPFYNKCKSNEKNCSNNPFFCNFVVGLYFVHLLLLQVKFQVKVAAGFRPKDIIVEEANNVRANWIVMDRCFSKHLTFRLSGTDCNISLVSDDEAVFCSCLTTNEAPESSSKSPKLRKGSISVEEASTSNCHPQSKVLDSNETRPCLSPRPASTRKESENQILSAPTPSATLPATTCKRSEIQILSGPTESTAIPLQQKKRDISKRANNFSGQPLQLTWEVVMDITQGFKSRTCLNGQDRNCMTYYGYLEDTQSFVLVKRFNQNCNSILEAERKAALSLQHKNILTLTGYFRNEHNIILVFPLIIEGTLDKHLCDLGRKHWKLTFQDKLKIAIGIAYGVRYMHEECPRGPIVHGELQPTNIFLTSDMQPMISGFEHATWLQFKQESPAFNNRYRLEDSLDHGSMLLIKSDIFFFGVLLLRLFCRRSAPRDDKILIEWARPLLLDRAFHLLLEDSDDVDIHAVYRVMAAARMCTISKPILRPPMSEVISILKGENFCIIQSSPSDTSS
ncbi:probable serine/threonine-protein kinase PBL25 [Jatropha curcas]|uniref:probable serine/threonine-protein kinase PBL25 n=1 Tax=Jatropha curcas TaxID=180498 RepID=UPI0018947833|nr:probable serine/threonine-protein kinase PBL25 [Jatropha curcas]